MVGLLLEQEHARAEAQSAHSFGFGIDHCVEVDGNPWNRPHLSCTFWLEGDAVSTLYVAHFTKRYGTDYRRAAVRTGPIPTRTDEDALAPMAKPSSRARISQFLFENLSFQVASHGTPTAHSLLLVIGFF